MGSDSFTLESLLPLSGEIQKNKNTESIVHSNTLSPTGHKNIRSITLQSSPKPFDKKTTKRTFNLLQHGVKWEQTFLGFFLVPYRRQPKGTIVLGSVRLPSITLQ
jgi:hypothetical protein